MKTIKFALTALVIYSILMSIWGCGVKPHLVPGKEVIEWNRPNKTPEWIDEEPGIKDNELLFVGLVDRAKREDLGRTDAREGARIALARDIASRVISKYGIGREREESRYVEEAAHLMSDAVIRSAMPKSWYTVRYYLTPFPGEQIENYYRLYVLMSIPEDDFLRAKASALKSLNEKQDNNSGKDLYRKFEKDIDSGAWPYTSD